MDLPIWFLASMNWNYLKQLPGCMQPAQKTPRLGIHTTALLLFSHTELPRTRFAATFERPDPPVHAQKCIICPKTCSYEEAIEDTLLFLCLLLHKRIFNHQSTQHLSEVFYLCVNLVSLIFSLYGSFYIVCTYQISLSYTELNTSIFVSIFS